MRGAVRTVLGDLDPATLGPTYSHEHLLTRPAEHLVGDGSDLLLDDEEKAAAELEAFRAAGGRSLVELTTREFGRNPQGLRRLAERTGTNIVATTGHVSEDYWRGVLDLESLSEPSLIDEFVRELGDEMDGSGIKAGAVKIGSSLDEISPTEQKIIRSAAAAQRQTGAPITTHTTAGTAAMAQVRALDRAGANLEQVCIGHLDRRLHWPDHLELARTGVFLGYDCIAKEQYQSDAERIRFILRLVEAGYGDRICLSGDMARRRYLEAWGGGPGYSYILQNFLPRLQAEGLDRDAARRLVVDNPARFLSWTK